MSFNKEAYIRYIIIDTCLTDKQNPYPKMDTLIEACTEKLGKEFSISAIQKDIKTMKEDEVLGFLAPIKYSKSHNGYYYADANYSIRKISLQDSEIEALKTATEMLSVFSGSRVSENFSQAVDKIFASIYERFPEGKSKLKIIQTDHSIIQKGFEHFEWFLQAAREKIPVCFVHYSYRHRDFKSIIFHPLILKEFQNNWYLVGYSENHKEIRTFGLDRIYDPKLLKRKFIEPKEDVRDDYFRHIYGVYPLEGKKLQRIEFMVSPWLSDYMNAHPIHSSQVRKKEMSHGHAIFSLHLIPSKELINFFLSLSSRLVVLHPKWIQEDIREHHQTALKYDKYYQK